MKNKNKIIELFKLLMKQIQYDFDFSSDSQTKTKNMFKLKAFAKVIKQLEKYNQEITSANQLKDIKDIGSGSLKRIDEILKTGTLEELKITPDMEKYLKFIENLEDVIGIGRKKAYELFKKHKITSIDELKKKYAQGKIDLPANIGKGLKYVDRIKENIPRADIDYLKEILVDTTLKIDTK